MDKPTLIPFIIDMRNGSCRVPMGDAILSLPLAIEGNFKLYLPDDFTGKLIKALSDAEITHSWTNSRLVKPLDETFNPKSPYFIARWGTLDFIKEYGPVNATQCWAKAIGMELRDPVPRLKRPCPPTPGKVAVFPTGAAAKRSLLPEIASAIVDALSSAGLAPTVCPHFEDPLELANFVSSCEYAVGVYTGPMHLAAAMGVKTVAIPVGDSPLAYRPLQENVHILAPRCDLCWHMDKRGATPYCKEAMPKCQKSVKPEFVLEALRKLDKGQGGIEALP